ncbi:MAG: hypothetical protein WD688_10150 [Candidatus Binatia bacterium]
MAIYEITKDQIRTVTETSFGKAGVRERSDLQRLLRQQIDIVSSDTLVIGEEFGEWEDSRRRIDLLGLDKSANLVVIELKRTDDGGHMELQALRYAAMISTMTFDKVVDAYGNYLEKLGREGDARSLVLDFLEWDEPNDEEFAQDVRIILVSAEFSKEITGTVMWLNNHELDIRCIRLKPYNLDGRTLIDIQQIVPLPEAGSYQVQLREKEQKKREGRSKKWDESSFMAEIERAAGLNALSVAKDLLRWSNEFSQINWSGVDGILTPTIIKEDSKYPLFAVRTEGRIVLRLRRLCLKPAFSEGKMQIEMLHKFNEIPGLKLTDEALRGKPSFKIDLLFDPLALQKFKAAVDWLVDQIKSSSPTNESLDGKRV